MTTHRQNTHHSATTTRLVASLALPLRELTDSLLESLIYSCGSAGPAPAHIRSLVGPLLGIRETLAVRRPTPQSIARAHLLSLEFLALTDRLSDNTLRALQPTIETHFPFFQDFWDAYRQLDALVAHLQQHGPLDSPEFTQAVHSYTAHNRRWHRALMRESTSYREFLLTQLRIYANGTAHIADSHCAAIIASDLFGEFHLRRKQRLLATALVNKYRI